MSDVCKCRLLCHAMLLRGSSCMRYYATSYNRSSNHLLVSTSKGFCRLHGLLVRSNLKSNMNVLQKAFTSSPVAAPWIAWFSISAPTLVPPMMGWMSIYTTLHKSKFVILPGARTWGGQKRTVMDVPHTEGYARLWRLRGNMTFLDYESTCHLRNCRMHCLWVWEGNLQQPR